MNHGRILSRAWTMVWQYRALWLFGFLFALTGGGGGLQFFRGNRAPAGPSTGPGGTGPFPRFPFPNFNWSTVLWIAAGLLAVLIVFGVVGIVVRYMSETALMAGADEIESTGAALSVRRGFRLGWSRQAGRLFLTDLVIFLPLVLAGLVLAAAAAAPLLLWLTRQAPLGVIGTLVTAALELLVILAMLALALGLSVVMPYVRRRVVLERQAPLAAVRQSLRLVRASLVDTGLMWLLLAALRIVWSLVMFPIGLVLIVLAVVVGGVPAALAYLMSQSWVWAVVVGVPLFLLLLIPSAAFIGGLFETYVSTSWTLTYRDVNNKFGDKLVTQTA